MSVAGRDLDGVVGPEQGCAGAVPLRPASAPAAVSVTAAAASIVVAWGDVAETGGSAVTGYIVEVSIDGVTWSPWSAPASSRQATISGLTNGTSYQVRVRAVTSAGPGAPSEIQVVTPFTRSSAPTAVTAVPGDRTIRISWTAPSATSGGADRTGYVIQYATGTNAWTERTVGPTTSSYTIGNLRNGVTYRVRVIAVNAAGRSTASTQIQATPRTVPSAPRSMSAKPGNASIRLTWSAPSSSGGASRTGYLVQYSAGGGSWHSREVSATTTSYVLRGLTNGTSYRVRVIAVNAAGRGTATTSATVKPRTVSSAPRSVSAKPGNRTIVVRWSAPAASGGADRTRYIVQYSANGGAWRTASSNVSARATSYTIRHLANGTTYRVRVIAVNAAGKSPASSTKSAKPRTKPSAPRVPSATASTTSVTIRWATPSSNGGASITSYRIQEYSYGSWYTVRTVGGSSRSATVSGLEGATSYRYRVVAVNAAGSTASSSIRFTTKRPSGCHPGYSGCVPIASDVDCAGGSGNGPAYVQGPVRVYGDDPYDLDGNGDGWGCE